MDEVREKIKKVKPQDIFDDDSSPRPDMRRIIIAGVADYGRGTGDEHNWMFEYYSLDPSALGLCFTGKIYGYELDRMSYIGNINDLLKQ